MEDFYQKAVEEFISLHKEDAELTEFRLENIVQGQILIAVNKKYPDVEERLIEAFGDFMIKKLNSGIRTNAVIPESMIN